MFQLCMVNHPSPRNGLHVHARVDTSMHPLGAELHAYYAAGKGVDCHFLDCHPDLMDVLLPMSVAHAQVLTVACVPVAYVRPESPHRWVWFAWMRAERRMLVVLVRDADGRLLQQCWLLMFARAGDKQRFITGAAATSCLEAVWDPATPERMECLELAEC